MKHDEICIYTLELQLTFENQCNSNLFLSLIVFHAPKNAWFKILTFPSQHNSFLQYEIYQNKLDSAGNELGMGHM